VSHVELDALHEGSYLQGISDASHQEGRKRVTLNMMHYRRGTRK
jgi:hypothetical protein